MATVNSAKATLVNKIDSLTSTATAKDTIFLAKALKEGSNSIDTGTAGQVLKTNAAADGVEWGTDGGLPSGGTVGQVVTNTASGTGGWADTAAGGKMVQVVNVQDSVVATSTLTIPIGDTIPQNNEGGEFMTLAITPTNASNLLKIDVVAIFSTIYDWRICALFQDSTADAIASQMASTLASYTVWTANFTHYMVAGTTSATTFKVRAAGHDAGTTTFNGKASTGYLGGSLASSITITEIEA